LDERVAWLGAMAAREGDRVTWHRVAKCDPVCAALADRHYSRRTVGSLHFMPPGQTIVLRAPSAVWGWWRPHPSSGIKSLNGLDGWTCTIFRNESRELSSSMILEAEAFIEECGPDGLITYVADAKIRSSNPGYCFKVAGYRVTGRSQDNRKTLLQKPWAGAVGARALAGKQELLFGAKGIAK